MFMPLMSIMNQARFMFGAKQLGEVWKPKGASVPALEGSTPEQMAPSTCVLGDAVSIRNSAQTEYSRNRQDTRDGFHSDGFGSKKSSIVSTAITGEDGSVQGQIRTQELKSTSKATVSLSVGHDGQKSLTVDYKDGRESVSVALDADTRVSWGSDGEPVISQGAQALSAGVLKAGGKDEILVRLSGANVVAGDGSTVINFSGKGGSFTGGTNVTYQGSYSDTSFDYALGSTVNFAGHFSNVAINAKGSNASFSGVFENSAIEGGGNGNTYSGFFTGSIVNALEGDNMFSGLFMEKSQITTGAGNDEFTGRFVDSTIDAGDGDNVFGTGIDLHAFNESTSDFTNTIIASGKGKDKFFGKAYESTLDLGDGDDNIKGVFMDSHVSAGEGNDTIAAMYGNGTRFDAGAGNDLLAVGTGIGNSLITGSGNNQVIMGYNKEGYGDSSSSLYGVGGIVAKSTWQTGDEAARSAKPKEFGELSANNLDASQGENLITIHSGEATHTIRTGAMNEDDGTAAPESALGDVRTAVQDSLSSLNDVAVDKASESAGSNGAAKDAGKRQMSVEGDPLLDEGAEGVAINGGTDERLTVFVENRSARNVERQEYTKQEVELTREQIVQRNTSQFNLLGNVFEDVITESEPETDDASAAGETKNASGTDNQSMSAPAGQVTEAADTGNIGEAAPAAAASNGTAGAQSAEEQTDDKPEKRSPELVGGTTFQAPAAYAENRNDATDPMTRSVEELIMRDFARTRAINAYRSVAAKG